MKLNLRLLSLTFFYHASEASDVFEEKKNDMISENY